MIADAGGDLFGTTYYGGADNDGTVFEISRTKDGYAGKPTTLVSFSGADGASPSDSLIADTSGDLFGTTELGGASGDGTVFELARTKGGYANAPTTLVSFVDGEFPTGSLVADAAGDLFGTTPDGGSKGDGSVFEVVKTGNAYGSKPITLVSFTGADGEYPAGSLTVDAAGDLFGATPDGGPDGGGTVFEIAKTKAGYAGKPTTLVSFAGADGSYPNGALIVDAAGDIFGTAQFGGANADGTVFEIVKTQGGYATAPTTLVTFTGANGELPVGGLIADAAGDLFGAATFGGAGSAGTVFEITHSGYMPPTAPVAPAAAITRSPPPVSAFVQAMATIGHGETSDLVRARATPDEHQPMLTLPRHAMA